MKTSDLVKKKLRRYLLITLITLVSLELSSQSLDSLLIEYELRQENRIDSIIGQYKKGEAIAILNLLPNVSYNYRAITDREFISIGINLQNFVSYFQQKRRNKIEAERLRIELERSIREEIIYFQQEIDLLEIEEISENVNSQNLQLEKDLHYIKSKQYNNHKITLEEWIAARERYNNFTKKYEAQKVKNKAKREALKSRLML